jgi:3-methyladenine DNA glycosylase AlkD
MGKPFDPVADLRGRLARVPMRRLRPCVRAWWIDHGLGDHPATVGKRVALALIEQPVLADKLAGIVVLHMLGPQLRGADLAAFAQLFAHGHLAGQGVVDAFTVKVLATLLDRTPGRREVVRTLSQWRGAETTWQRRAACLAFIKLAPTADATVADQILAIAGTVVWSPERSDQTAVGWVLRELSLSEPMRVEAFVRRHARLMSKECARQAVAKFSSAMRRDLLAHHKRATTLRLG